MSSVNGLHVNSTVTPDASPHSHSGSPQRERSLGPMDTQSNKQQELEELNTKELAQRISSELKRYSIPQAVFAQRVLCRSQGTLSDLLRNPKPWSKLKSGRETFRRMWKWLQEPEFQRMSALRLAGNIWSFIPSKTKFIKICFLCLFCYFDVGPYMYLKLILCLYFFVVFHFAIVFCYFQPRVDFIVTL
jgi:hypothetical protein